MTFQFFIFLIYLFFIFPWCCSWSFYIMTLLYFYGFYFVLLLLICIVMFYQPGLRSCLTIALTWYHFLPFFLVGVLLWIFFINSIKSFSKATNLSIGGGVFWPFNPYDADLIQLHFICWNITLHWIYHFVFSLSFKRLFLADVPGMSSFSYETLVSPS